MGINGLSAIGIMLAFIGIAVAATIALREWVFRQAARNLEACFSDASQQLPYVNLPALALETLTVLRTPSRRTALTRSHWMSTQRSIAWGCAVLDTAAPDLQLTDRKLGRWYRGILTDAKRYVPAKVFVSARQFAADSLNGRSARTTTHPTSWLDDKATEAEPREDAQPDGAWVTWYYSNGGQWLPYGTDHAQTELTAHGAMIGTAVVAGAEQPAPVDHTGHDLCRCSTCAENGCTYCRTCGYSIDEVPS